MTTYIAKDKDIQRIWYVVDARDKVLGRLATRVATILRGKDKVLYSPHQDVGDEVIVINASKVRVTGKKLSQKTYSRYSAYPGGITTENLETVMKKRPEFVIRHAVQGMLPRNKLGRKLIKKLRVYADDKHPHVSQKPKELVIK